MFPGWTRLALVATWDTGTDRLFHVFLQVSCLVKLLQDKKLVVNFLLTIYSHLILSDFKIQFTRSKYGFLNQNCLQVCCYMCSLHIDVHQKLNEHAMNKKKTAIDPMPPANMLQTIPTKYKTSCSRHNHLGLKVVILCKGYKIDINDTYWLT